MGEAVNEQVAEIKVAFAQFFKQYEVEIKNWVAWAEYAYGPFEDDCWDYEEIAPGVVVKVKIVKDEDKWYCSEPKHDMW